MASVNRVTILGNLGQDPDVRALPSGDPVTTISVATNERWTDAKGEQQERVEWHRIVLFKRLAEIAEQYLAKGNPVYVEGRLRTRKWTDQKGVDRYSTEIIGDRVQLLGTPNGRPPAPPLEADPATKAAPKKPAAKKPAAKAKPPAAEQPSFDDVPF